jgi:hypothetical protein
MPTASNSGQENVTGFSDRCGRFIQPAAAVSAQKVKGPPQLIWLAKNVAQKMSHRSVLPRNFLQETGFGNRFLFPHFYRDGDCLVKLSLVNCDLCISP